MQLLEVTDAPRRHMDHSSRRMDLRRAREAWRVGNRVAVMRDELSDKCGMNQSYMSRVTASADGGIEMNKSDNRLIEYLEAMDGSFGCVPRYEEQFSAEPEAWRTGWYAGLLADIVKLVGGNNLLAWAEVHQALLAGAERAEERLRDVMIEACNRPLDVTVAIAQAAGYVRCKRCDGDGILMMVIGLSGGKRCDCINGWREANDE